MQYLALFQSKKGKEDLVRVIYSIFMRCPSSLKMPRKLSLGDSLLPPPSLKKKHHDKDNDTCIDEHISLASITSLPNSYTEVLHLLKPQLGHIIKRRMGVSR